MAASRGAILGRSLFRNNERGSSSNTRCFSDRQLTTDSALYDKSHSKIYCGKKNKPEKQKLKDLSDKRRTKLLKLASKDLSPLPNTFSQGHHADKFSADEDALQFLMRQLNQVNVEQKAHEKAVKAQNQYDSEVAEVPLQLTHPAEGSITRFPEPSRIVGEVVFPANLVENPPNIAGLHRESAERKERFGLGQVQVCMGVKCKKLGSEQLLAAFEERIRKSGMASVVEAVGCKCMGKCRNAPNVKVQNDLCKEIHMGVGMGDVDLVLDRHFGVIPDENELKSEDLVYFSV